jgi:flagellar basal body P-ring formation protein FlgA
MRLWRCGALAVVTTVALAVGMAAAGAADIENLAAIRAAVAAAVHPRLGTGDATVDIGAIDSRLRLPACPALAVSLDGDGAMLTAKVDCPSPDWTIYVPVRVHAWVEAVVAAANLTPDTQLTADLLSHRRVDMFAVSGALVTDPARVAGKILRVGLAAGSPVLESFVENPLVIRRGQRVLLTLSDGQMVIRDSVIALDDGRVGDDIAMRNPESQKVIHATVSGDGTADIRF